MERGSILAIIATKFPGIMNESLELPSGDYWVALPTEDEKCPRCDGRSLTLIRLKPFNPLTGVTIYCSPERKLLKLVDLSHEQIMEIEQKARQFASSCDPTRMQIISVDEARTRGIAARSSQASGSVTTNPISLDPLLASAPVPDGYRNVAWLKNHEAQAISMAYQQCATIPVRTTSGKDVFRAEYRANSKEGAKCKAKVKGVRIRKDGRDQNIGWVRAIEATAALEALTNEESVERADTNLGVAVLVQFFAKDSIEEKTFRSCTRVLRKL